MIKVVHMIGKMHMGGAETFIMNVYRNIDTEKVKFDFIVHSDKKEYYDEEIERRGGKIYRITPISKNLFKHMKELRKILINNKYDVIHRHTNSTIVFLDLLMAKKCNIKKRIAHSHSNKCNRGKLINTLFKLLMNKYTNVRLACSEEAGEFLFGKSKKNMFEIVYNGIELKKFLYNEEQRNLIREKNKINQHQLVLGHVGRFEKVKNHKLIIDIFENFLKKEPNSILWLIGEGPEKNVIAKNIKNRGIEGSVKFWGNINNVNEIINGMDVFVFPSIKEGLGISLIEAQYSGLKCVVSEAIPNMAIVTDRVKKVSINDNINTWVNEIKPCTNRKITTEEIAKSKFNIENVVQSLLQIYSR